MKSLVQLIYTACGEPKDGASVASEAEVTSLLLPCSFSLLLSLG